MSSPVADPGPGVVAVASLNQARKHKRRFDAVITLEDPGCRRALRLRFGSGPHPAHLVLDFEDIDFDEGVFRVASPEQVNRALAFAREHQGGSLLVHCYHGVGRSAAVALAIIADRLGPGQEARALDQLLAIRPEATPNLLVVRYADDLLGRGGELVQAVAAWEAVTPHVAQLRVTRRSLVERCPELYARR